MSREVVAVTWWRQYGEEHAWSVSLEDTDGEEIRCIGGADSWEEARDMARAEASRLGVGTIRER